MMKGLRTAQRANVGWSGYELNEQAPIFPWKIYRMVKRAATTRLFSFAHVRRGEVRLVGSTVIGNSTISQSCAILNRR